MNLILVNGPCGAGKSTTSRLLAEYLPGSELIQTDALRKSMTLPMFPDPLGSSEAMALMWDVNIVGRNIARAALSQDRPVIVDSIKYQTEWVAPWERLGEEMGATVTDICITAAKEVIEKRAAGRGYRIGGRLTPEKVSVLYDEVTAFYADRPDAIIINNEHLEPLEIACTIAECLENGEPVSF